MLTALYKNMNPTLIIRFSPTSAQVALKQKYLKRKAKKITIIVDNIICSERFCLTFEDLSALRLLHYSVHVHKMC